MRKLKLRIRKWVSSYVGELILLLGTVIIYGFFKSPELLYALFIVVAVIIIKNILDWRKARQEPMTKLAESIDRLSTQFAKFAGVASWNYSIRSIANEFISKYGTKSEKIKGWTAYFDQDRGISGQLSNTYRSFERRLREYIENPKSKAELSGLIREFLDLVGLHYKMHENFGEMVKDVDVSDKEVGQRYNEFKKEYDEFHRGLRGIAPDLKSVVSVELEGKFYYDFAKDFPIEFFNGGVIGEGV